LNEVISTSEISVSSVFQALKYPEAEEEYLGTSDSWQTSNPGPLGHDI